MISRLLSALGGLESPPSPEEVGDALWLAGHLRPAPAPADDPEPTTTPPDSGERGQVVPVDDRPAGTANGDGATGNGKPTAQPSGGNGHDPPEGTARYSTEAHWYPLPADGAGADELLARSPAAPALPGTLRLSRALRPLNRRVSSRYAQQLDEPATVEFVADTGLWLPQFRAAAARWLEVALIVDTGASMVLWADVATELATLLERQGAFRDVRVWHLDNTAERAQVLLRPAAAPGGTGRSPRELVDHGGRRLILVLSDCVGPVWANGLAERALAMWGNAGPVAILQPLPQRLWDRSHVDLVRVHLRADRPGLPNRLLGLRSGRSWDLLDAGEVAPHRRVPIPVLELESRWLTPWAALTAGASGNWIPATVLLASESAAPRPEEFDDEPAGELSPLDAVMHFREAASPTAFQLAGYLSAAPLSIDVMRLVQRAMLPGSRPAHLSEVFLSGLLTRIPAVDGIEYDFLPTVRNLLLANLTRPEALRVVNRVSAYVNDQFGSPHDFAALISGSADLASLSRPFAAVAGSVLRSLGGDYLQAGNRLLAIGEAELVAPPVTATNNDSQSQDTGEEVSTPAPQAAEQGRRAAEQPIIWTDVPPRNPNFTGREDLLHRLRQRLDRLDATVTAVVPQALHGLGGVGKTQLAIEYAYRHATEYDLVCWIPAEDPTDVRTRLAALAPALGIAPSADASHTRTAVLDALRRGRPFRRWLLIFDNADHPDDLRELFPAATGHILVTSRNQTWLSAAASIEVNVFERAESIELLGRRGGIPASEANDLAESLGDLPLALEQAAAWYGATGMPISEYIQALDARSNDILSDRVLSGYPRSLVATWALTIDRLRTESPAAVQLLEVCSFFGPEPIRLRWFEQLGSRVDYFPAPLSDAVQDEIEFARAVRELGRYALARVDPRRNTMLIHRLVQAVVRDTLDRETQNTYRRAVHTVLAVANPGRPDEPNTWTQHAQISPHLLPCRAINGETKGIRQTIVDQARYRYRTYDLEGSRDLSELARARWLEMLGPDDVQTLLITRHLGNALRSLGDIDRAFELDEETYKRFNDTQGSDHEHTLFTASSFGADLRLRGEFHAAHRLDTETLPRNQDRLGEKHPDTLRNINNLAVDLRLLGEFADARQRDNEALMLRIEILAPQDDEILSTYNSLARDLVGEGRYDDALRVLSDALDRFRPVLGKDFQRVVDATRTLGIVLRKLGRYQDARTQAEATLARYKARLGPLHPETLSMTVTFCNDLRTVGDYKRASEVGQEALNGYRTRLSDSHPFSHVAATDLAIVLRAQGENERARELNQAAYDALRDEKRLGPEHAYTMCAATNLANDLAAMGEHQSARDLSGDTLARSRRVRPDDHPYTLYCALNHGLDLRATGDVEAGDKLVAETVDSLRRILGPQHPETVVFRAGRRADADIDPPPM